MASVRYQAIVIEASTATEMAEDERDLVLTVRRSSGAAEFVSSGTTTEGRLWRAYRVTATEDPS